MAEPAREEVIVAILDWLEAQMTGTRPGWGGSYPNPVAFRRDAPSGEQVNARPTIAVVIDMGSTIAIDVTAGGQAGFRHALAISFAGYVKATADATAATWKERLWDDLVTVLEAPGAPLRDMVTRIEWGERDDEWVLEPQGEWVQAATFVFHETKTVT